MAENLVKITDNLNDDEGVFKGLWKCEHAKAFSGKIIENASTIRLKISRKSQPLNHFAVKSQFKIVSSFILSSGAEI